MTAVTGVIALVVIALVVLLLLAYRRGWLDAARRHPKTTTAVVVAALAIGLPLGWYLGSPLFISNTIDEPPPAALAATATPATTTVGPSPSAVADPVTPSATPGAALMSRTGMFSGADDFHFGRGTARFIETSPGTYTLRLEDFEVRNGPALYVYLSPAADGYAESAIELAQLKADRGNQNYEIPAGTDLSKIRSVVIWCKQFGVLFATAPLS